MYYFFHDFEHPYLLEKETTKSYYNMKNTYLLECGVGYERFQSFKTDEQQATIQRNPFEVSHTFIK